MQFALGVGAFEFLEVLERNVSSEFGRALDCEDWFFAENDVLADVHYGVVLYGSLRAECFTHFLLDFLGCIVDEDACVRLTLRHLR